MGDYKIYYITKGPIRGPCEHKHRTIEFAYHCLWHDIQAAEKDGSLCDRRIYAIDNEQERDLSEREIYELDYVKRMMLYKTVLKHERRIFDSENANNNNFK